MKPCNAEILTAAFGRIHCGQEVQGGIRLCSACTAKLRDERPVKVGKLRVEPEDLSGFPEASFTRNQLVLKRDLENLDVRLYLALKAMVPHWEAMSEQSCTEGGVKYIRNEDAELMAAEKVMRDFEDSFGPLPEFAIARNFGLELTPGTQLYTKNGRRCGNGWLIKVGQRDTGREIFTAYTVLTDAGSIMEMTEQELESQFEVGDWICTLDRIAEDFDRHGFLKAMGSC